MRALLLIGSPRGMGSTSRSLGHYLLDRLGEKGWEVEEVHLQKAIRSPEGVDGLTAAAGSADLIILSFPVYFDSTPAAVIRAMEGIASRKGGAAKKTSLMAMANCGFLEAEQNRTALDICRLFARDAGFEWKGSLALGGGGAINGRPLDEAGGMARNARKALDLAASALAEGKDVPGEASRLMAKSFAPRWLLIPIINRMWKSMAQGNGALARIKERPFQEEKE